MTYVVDENCIRCKITASGAFRTAVGSSRLGDGPLLGACLRSALARYECAFATRRMTAL